MNGSKTKSSRRAFFLSGGAVLGAGVATAAGASALTREESVSAEDQLKQLRQQLEGLEDREAIRQLHLAFTTLVEQQQYEAAAALFDENGHLALSGVSANGRAAIQRSFATEYRQQSAPAIHNAYRQNPSQQSDTVTLSEDRLQATATFHVEVELCTPLQSDCTAAEMARLQGNAADRRWEAGRFEAKYVKAEGQWKISALSYQG
jgi:site-specific DNA-cytosine methylase